MRPGRPWPCRRTCRPRPSTTRRDFFAPAPSHLPRAPAAGCARTRTAAVALTAAQAAADHRRWRRALRPGLRRAGAFADAPRRSGGRDPGRQGRAALGPSAARGRDRCHRRARGQRAGGRAPMSCSPSGRGSRISPPARARCSAQATARWPQRHALRRRQA